LGREGAGGRKTQNSLDLNIRCWGDGWEGGGCSEMTVETHLKIGYIRMNNT
jgi:hypothetical protein